jgi:tetratricopeptide (TPR) repeat protein
MTAGELTVTRVRLLSRLCGTLYYSDRHEQMKRASAEATAIAAQLGDQQAAALAAAARRRAYWGPGHLERRLADSTQLLRFARAASDVELTLQGHAWLVVDLLERGDRAAVEAQIEAFTAGAQKLRQPLYLWNAAVWRAMRALLEGRLEQADQLAAEAVSYGIRGQGVTAPQYYAVQLLGIRREQARMAELEPAVRELLASNPARPAWRAGLATLLCEGGRLDEARDELETLAQAGLATIPQDGDWMITVTLLADVAAAVGDAERAALLYELLLPFAQAHVVIGLGAVCLGATAGYLGRLALTIDRRSDALEHLWRAIESNRALQAPVVLAHTQLDCALALGPGAPARALIEEARQTAAQLDLPAVGHRAENLHNH